jgi:hypothetical protein
MDAGHTMSGFILATTTSGISGGTVQVRIPGAPAVVTAQATWQLDGVTSGCQVLLAHQGGRLWAVALVGAKGSKPQGSSDGEAPALPPEQVGGWGGESTLPPSWSGTWRGSAWRTDTENLIQGAQKAGDPVNAGAAFWSAAAWGDLKDARVRLRRLPGGDPAPVKITLALLQGDVGDEWPAVLATAVGPMLPVGGEEWWSLPAEWTAQVSTGAAGGVGLVGDAFAVVAGATADINFTWTRTV